MGVTTSGVLSRRHRTALFVDADAYDAGDPYAERVNRLRQSLNGSNIKVDEYEFRSGSAPAPVTGIVVSNFGAGLPQAESDLDSIVGELHSWAKERGYDQVLVSLP